MATHGTEALQEEVEEGGQLEEATVETPTKGGLLDLTVKKPIKYRKKLDYKAAERLAALQCTQEQIAAYFEVDRSTIKRRKKSDPEFAAALERGAEQGLIRLRNFQWKAAARGNPTMLVWLGKQYLSQQDRGIVEHTGPEGGPIQFAKAQETLLTKLKAMETDDDGKQLGSGDTRLLEARVVPETSEGDLE